MICEKKRQLKCSGWVALVESVVSRCCTLRPVDEILKSAVYCHVLPGALDFSMSTTSSFSTGERTRESEPVSFWLENEIVVVVFIYYELFLWERLSDENV